MLKVIKNNGYEIEIKKGKENYICKSEYQNPILFLLSSIREQTDICFGEIADICVKITRDGKFQVYEKGRLVKEEKIDYESIREECKNDIKNQILEFSVQNYFSLSNLFKGEQLDKEIKKRTNKTNMDKGTEISNNQTLLRRTHIGRFTC